MQRARRAVSPIIGTIILIAIIITVGTATWAYANSAVSSTMRNQGEDVAQDVNLPKERYSIVNLLLNRTVSGSPNRDQLTIWV